MANKRASVSETVSWLSYPRQAYPNFYLHGQRIEQRFRGYFGSIRDFTQSVEKSGHASGSVKALFGEAGIQAGKGGGTELSYDVGNPLAQALVLRAYLANIGELETDAPSASVTDFVLVRGPGGLLSPEHASDSRTWEQVGVPADVAAEVVEEQRRQAAISTEDDHYPLYWVAHVLTDHGVVVSLCGAASLFGSDVRQWLDVPSMTYCIFGQKARDWRSWTLVQPLHVWIEPPGKATWG